jgi:hypothetical protein
LKIKILNIFSTNSDKVVTPKPIAIIILGQREYVNDPDLICVDKPFNIWNHLGPSSEAILI